MSSGAARGRLHASWHNSRRAPVVGLRRGDNDDAPPRQGHRDRRAARARDARRRPRCLLRALCASDVLPRRGSLTRCERHVQRLHGAQHRQGGDGTADRVLGRGPTTGAGAGVRRPQRPRDCNGPRGPRPRAPGDADRADLEKRRRRRALLERRGVPPAWSIPLEAAAHVQGVDARPGVAGHPGRVGPRGPAAGRRGAGRPGQLEHRVVQRRLLRQRDGRAPLRGPDLRPLHAGARFSAPGRGPLPGASLAGPLRGRERGGGARRRGSTRHRRLPRARSGH